MPGVYWLAVVLISVVGTLITDNLTRQLRRLARDHDDRLRDRCSRVTFAVWYASERTLSIHTIVTTRREAFYWLAVLFTFALGTAAGDLIAETARARLLAVGADVRRRDRRSSPSPTSRFALNAILAFWIAYILTRPLGASIGDYLSQPQGRRRPRARHDVTSVIFLATILALVVYLTVTKRDRIEADGRGRPTAAPPGARARPRRRQQDRRRPRRWSTRCASARRPARRASSCSSPTPTTSRSTASSRGHRATASSCSATRCRCSRTRPAREVEGRVADSPNAYDDIVEELEGATTARSSSRRSRPRLALAARRPTRAGRAPRLPADDGHRHALSGRIASR